VAERYDSVPEVLDLLEVGLWRVTCRDWIAGQDRSRPSTEAGGVHEPVGPRYSACKLDHGPVSKVIGDVIRHNLRATMEAEFEVVAGRAGLNTWGSAEQNWCLLLTLREVLSWSV
jgi:hypothetical protein